MNIVGIVAEYNPFHEGHAYQIRMAKKLCQADVCVVVMSGDYVQRGEPAFFDKYSRTEAALKDGADIIFELPVRFALSSAGDFAYGAVSSLKKLGVTHICFGSEYGETDRFIATAEAIYENDKPDTAFSKMINTSLREGLSYAEARDAAIRQNLSEKYPDDEFLKSPNNILGIEYCLAIKKLEADIIPVTIKREGQSYDNDSETDSFTYPSSGALRKKHTENGTPHLEAKDFSQMIYYSLRRLADEMRVEGYSYPKDLTPELANRLIGALDGFRDFDSYLESVRTKAYTTSRIKRCLMQTMLGICGVDTEVRCLRLLGLRQEAGHIIKEIKKSYSDSDDFHIITRLADDLTDVPESAGTVFKDQDIFAADLYRQVYTERFGVALPNEYQRAPVII